MISEIIQDRKFVGFTYYPVLEIVLGIFFLFMAFFLPLLFARYNGLKFLEQWDEWLFLLIFFLIFLLLGKSLAYQKLRAAALNNGTVSFYQDMRAPAIQFNCNTADWKGTLVKKSETIIVKQRKNVGGFYSIYIKINDEEKLLYGTTSFKEAKKLEGALNQLLDSLKRS